MLNVELNAEPTVRPPCDVDRAIVGTVTGTVANAVDTSRGAASLTIR